MPAWWPPSKKGGSDIPIRKPDAYRRRRRIGVGRRNGLRARERIFRGSCSGPMTVDERRTEGRAGGPWVDELGGSLRVPVS